jgi:pyruvate/2-oxoglutarate dehydrogenase complex dihydrolipoamide acyltransferase (E2) component
MAVVCRPSLLRAFCIALLLMVAAIGAGSDASAQRPSQAQINAMRQSCRSDYMAHCSSVPTGGAPALNCLKQNLANLSPGCQTAVKAIAPESPPAAASTASPSQAAPPAPAPSMSTPNMSTPSAPAAPPTATAQPSAAGAGRASQARLRSVRQSCGPDYRVHCAGIPPGGSASIACLKRNIATLSGTCKQALGAVAAGATAAAAPAVAPPPVEPAPLLVSPREELFILRMACGGDYAAFCRGLRPGAGRIAACLHYNSASLSPRCQQALTALREGR